MRKNVASQRIGAQMITASDGSAFTGAVTVSVTGDAGTQATGSVGAGACTHEGNGYHTYAPAQAETNYDLIAFTFTGTGAIPVTVQVYTNFPQTGDSFALIGTTGSGLTSLASQSSVDAIDNFVDTEIADIQSRLPAALVGGRMDVSVGAMAADTVTASALATSAVDEIVDAVWDEVLTAATHNVASSAGRRLRQVDASFVIHTGTAQAGGASSITLAAGASATNDIYKNDGVIIVGGTGVGESGIVTAYNGTTKVATVSPAFVITPDNTSEYEIIPAMASTQSIGADVITAAATAADFGTEVGTAVWASAARTLTALDEDNTTMDMDATIRAAVGLASANLDTQIADLPTNSELTTALAAADDAVLAAIAALNNLSAAQVNAEVVDALNVDTYAEISSIPAATTTLTNMIRLLYSMTRNKTTQTATTFTLRNDADSGNIGTATVSDDGTTATKGELA